GGKKEAAALNVPLLGQIPIDVPTREGGDSGKPVALMPAAESKVSAAFHEVAEKVVQTVGKS
ncbi:MAG: chromosome partitioning protein, partial [Akkermansiaceae bacterium]|nr:chromosome partitioning protein [Akkermansiaceae bacterium]